MFARFYCAQILSIPFFILATSHLKYISGRIVPAIEISSYKLFAAQTALTAARPRNRLFVTLDTPVTRSHAPIWGIGVTDARNAIANSERHNNPSASPFANELVHFEEVGNETQGDRDGFVPAWFVGGSRDAVGSTGDYGSCSWSGHRSGWGSCSKRSGLRTKHEHWDRHKSHIRQQRLFQSSPASDGRPLRRHRAGTGVLGILGQRHSTQC